MEAGMKKLYGLLIVVNLVAVVFLGTITTGFSGSQLLAIRMVENQQDWSITLDESIIIPVDVDPKEAIMLALNEHWNRDNDRAGAMMVLSLSILIFSTIGYFRERKQASSK